MATINYYTAEGLQKLKDELQDLKVRGRAKAAEDLREARDKGDLSENAEYDAAKDAQGLLGKEAGDVAEITVPAGKLQFEILEVGR